MSCFFVAKIIKVVYTFYGDNNMKKGFTLVELLAVIVVLSIISVISVPLVSDVIEKGRIGAIQNSVEFYVSEIETAYAEWSIEGYPNNLSVNIKEDGYVEFSASELNTVLKVKGTKPLSGTIVVNSNLDDSNSLYGFVVDAKLKYDGGFDATYTYDLNTAGNNKKKITVVRGN